MNRAIFSFLCFIALSGFFTASAQQKATGLSNKQLFQNLDSIVIQDQRLQIPFSKLNRDITILDQDVIKSLPVKSVDELLSYVAGVDVRQRGVWGTQADIGINGGTFDETLILLNGVKIIDPQTGHNMMNLPVSLDAIQRIEILKGAAASSYGINALNGAINIITRQPKKTGVSVHAFAGSSFRKDTSSNKLYAGYGLEASVSLATKKVQHFLSLSTTQSNGYRHNTPINNDKVFYQNKIQLGNQSNLHFMGGFVYNDYGSNGFYSPPGDKESKETVQTAIAGLNANIHVNDHWELKPGISYRYSFDDYIFVRQHPDIYENLHHTNVIDATLNNSFYTGIGTFGLGMELRHAAIKSSNLGDHTRSNFGLFGAYSLNIIPKTLINIGLYANYSDDFGWDWLPSIDVGYQLYKHIRIFANAGKGIRLPTYTDWYYKGPENIGNPNLMPEEAWHTEIGLKYNGNKLHASASYFYRNTTDFIDWVKDSLSQPWQPQNFQDIKTQGISISSDYRLIPENKYKNFSLLAGLSYTWLHPQLEKTNKTDQDGKYSHYALENLRNQLCARLNIGFHNRFHFTIGGQYAQRVSYKDYFLLSARLSADIKKFQIYADANNITNVQYVEAGAVPLPGSWFTLGAKWHILE